MLCGNLLIIELELLKQESLRSSKTPQQNEWLVMIEETQKQLEDTVKALDIKVKDSITAL